MAGRGRPVSVGQVLGTVLLAPLLLLGWFVPVASAAGSVGAISGTVRDSVSTDPLPGICVTAEPVGGGTTVVSAQTNKAGTYMLAKLPPASYVVEFSGCGTTSYYVTQFNDDEPTLADANPVTVSAGTTTGGINAAMQLGGRLAGRVTDAATGDPLPQICVTADYEGGGGVDGARPGAASGDVTNLSTLTNANGHYTLNGIPLGPYDLTFIDCHKHAYLEARTSATVDAGETSTNDITMALAGAISGTVTSNASTPVDLKGICVGLIEGGAPEGGAFTNVKGAFTLSQLYPGSYQVEFTDCKHDVYLEQFYPNETGSVSGDTVVVASGQKVTGINAIMVKGGEFVGRVTGTAKHAPGIAGICAEAAPVPDSRVPYQPPFQYGVTNSNGRYVLKGLSTWSYDVTFNECSPVNPGYAGQGVLGDPLNADAGVTFHINARLAAA
jgi:hypothetical protein